MATLKYLVVDPSAEPESREAPLNYDEIVALVGYPVEVINILGGKAVMYVCEEGKQKGMPFNERATRMADGSLREGDYISGTAVVVGPMAAGGVDSSLPDETLADLLATAQ